METPKQKQSACYGMLWRACRRLRSRGQRKSSPRRRRSASRKMSRYRRQLQQEEGASIGQRSNGNTCNATEEGWSWWSSDEAVALCQCCSPISTACFQPAPNPGVPLHTITESVSYNWCEQFQLSTITSNFHCLLRCHITVSLPASRHAPV